jgi:hypothetical protein
MSRSMHLIYEVDARCANHETRHAITKSVDDM